jgi:hypothetical protein
MKTYPIKTDDNRTFAFEISNAYIGANTIADLLRQNGRVTNLKKRQPFQSPGDVHIEFQYADVDFMVWEPYGDNSRYWIGPKNDADRSVGIEDLEHAFAVYRVPLLRKITGDLVTFNLRALFSGTDA